MQSKCVQVIPKSVPVVSLHIISLLRNGWEFLKTIYRRLIRQADDISYI